jgi:2-amino-4-hydroxy-6-hydroxymethyldihydropteridine diphosphokinase
VGGVVPVAIALGSNVGDRRAHLAYAIERLTGVLTHLTVSSFHDTAPVGFEAQPRFLNAAAVGESGIDAQALLGVLQAIEADRGRERSFQGAPRTLDLDLILFGALVSDAPNLQVPHPRFRERHFVLAPLVEIAPAMRDPVTGRTVAELLGDLGGAGSA